MGPTVRERGQARRRTSSPPAASPRGEESLTKTHFPVARAEPSLAVEAEYRPRANVAALAMRGPEGVEKILPGIPTPMMAILRLVKPKQYRARFVQVWFRRA